MFDDILTHDETTDTLFPKGEGNKRIVCPDCGVRLVEITDDFDSDEYKIIKWRQKCRQCADKP